MKIALDPNLVASKIDQPVPYPFAKRVFDFCLTALLLVLLTPLFLVIFLAMKIESWLRPESKGHFLYKETRISQGKPFNFYKIGIYKTAALSQTLEEKGIVHTKHLEKDRANLTAVGKFLKKFYLDEAAQLINVLKGEMSFVGTRPWNPAEYKRETSLGIYRKKILKAGITGLVQITKGRHKEYGGDRLIDDYYVVFCRNHSPVQIILLDLKIIGLSIIKILKGEGL